MIGIYYMMAEMSDITGAEKMKDMPVMLKGDGLATFSMNEATLHKLEEAVNVLRTWYNSSEKKSRLLKEWTSMILVDEMQVSPKEAEIIVF